MRINLTVLTEAERDLYEWNNGMSSSFKTHLMNAISVADIGNMAKLAMAFPDHVRVFKSFKSKNGWWDALIDRIQV